MNKDYPHTDITKQVLTTKLKAIRIKFRQAVDSGRKSGHNGVVFLYLNLCEHIWGGSLATDQIVSGVENIEMDLEATSTSSTETAGSLNSSVDENDWV